ncbi:MAG: 3-isopropylmalate dehydratase small subunit [Pigmentiphaga sp.]|uniref:3-isopropylmalate dehydratase small subunit n=1 Tax=Pigmentiphaga sp. TaxID=1977564 RepID=UPI003B54EE78
MREPFTVFEGLAVPLDRTNVDTDAIIPKQFMKSISRTGYGDNLFDEWRYLDHGEPGDDCRCRPLAPDFVLNQPRYRGAGILVAGDNFGCGSSREHAAWALRDYGFRVVIAPGFADIFRANCLKNGLLPVVLDAPMVARLMGEIAAEPGYRMTVDLVERHIVTSAGATVPFEIDADARQRLLEGLDDIAITLQSTALIRDYEELRRQLEPWVFEDKA